MRHPAVLELIAQQKHKLSLPSRVCVVVSYETGRDGFWVLWAALVQIAEIVEDTDFDRIAY